MSEASPASLVERVQLARARLRSLPATGPGVFGAPDPESGERWNAGNVLGHLAEMLPFWTGQVEAILAGSTEAGRGVAGYESRRSGVESGQTLAEADLRRRIEDGIDGLLMALGRISPEDLGRPVVYHARTGDRNLTLVELLEELLVGHLEGHARQLEELGAGGRTP